MIVSRRQILRGVVACGVSRAAAPAETAHTVLAAADVHVAGYPTVAAIDWINEQLHAEFGGEVAVRVYDAGQLGSEKDTLDLARVGALGLTRVHSSVLNNAVPVTRILSLPYVFDSIEHMRRAFDGSFGRRVLAACEQRGLIGLAIYDSGARSFYNSRRPIETPQDLHGLKLRVPQSDIFMESITALGGNPTPLAYSAVFSSLQTRLIDGAENNWPSFHSSRHFEAARYWSESEHSHAPDMLLLSRSIAAALPADRLEFLIDAARRSVPFMRLRWDSTVASSRRAVIEAGVAVNRVDKAAFQRAARPLLDKHLGDPEIRSLYESSRNG